MRRHPAAGACRDREPRHRPRRLRCLLCLRREARPAGARPRAADRGPCRRTRRRRHGLLCRPHLRRPLGHADVPGPGAVPAGHGDRAGHGQVQARERADPGDLRVGHRRRRAGLAGRGLSRPDATINRTEAAPAAEALAAIARRIEDEIGITVSIGLSCNKFLAKLASELREAARLLGHRPCRGEGLPGAAVGAQDPRRRRGHGKAHGGGRARDHRRPAGR